MSDQQARPAGRTETGRFAPGVSGNPSGKPRSAKDFEALCRERTPQAITRLMEIGRGKGVAAVKALEIVIAYGYGRPQQSLNVTAARLAVPSEFVGATAGILERAIAEAEARETIEQGSPAPNPESGSVDALPPSESADPDGTHGALAVRSAGKS